MPDSRKGIKGSEDVVLVIKKSIFNFPVGTEFNVTREVRSLFELTPVDKDVNGGHSFPIEASALKSLLGCGLMAVKE